ncbi:Cleavage and polyadenylation specificity factor subunit [Wickerhamomyces ciferrii]|uniref:Cleavage and polyadenylation specificity factor subunit n=1 Tax=Wickerhamomyces ciferrii (strain ATCC 14091 / BCRC 22168 / CBS 111 / JCM 3599 / NBRC 0793 / NRRL Y-1031 F-60-10) TaxID=1206466 RepID=K0KZ48_WICCF|nr:Cleavage and polyadenylation specificity factor subunit [Wickerhamomyces ciferrii]CCH46383.1 Cleavage and polyadenylation specificity factor subunit [Wickerhamomyces ciferrii]
MSTATSTAPIATTDKENIPPQDASNVNSVNSEKSGTSKDSRDSRESKEPKDRKKRKITYTKPSAPPRAIEPFQEGLSIEKKIYPLSNYTLTQKSYQPLKDHELKEDEAEKEALKESKQYKRKTYKSDLIPNNLLYFKNLKKYNDFYGTRRFLQFLIVVGGEKEPAVLLLKEHNQLIVPGGYLNHDEDEKTGAERILKELFDEEELAAENGNGDANGTTNGATNGSAATVQEPLTIGETIARWWRTDLKPFVYPYLPRHVTRPKELIKLVYVDLPKTRKLSYPNFYKSFAPYPLVDLYDKSEPELKSIPLFLSKILFTFIDEKNNKEYKDFIQQYSSINVDQPPKPSF